MELDRTEFLNAVKFLKTSLCKNPSTPNLMNLHVCASGDECIMTAADGAMIKRVTLKSRRKVNFKSWYAIDPCTLEAFVCLLKKQKGAKKKDFEIVEISKFNLKSMGVTIVYENPDLIYPNLDKLFVTDGEGCKEIHVSPKRMRCVMAGFPGYDCVKVTIIGAEKQVIVKQENTGYSAVLLPIRVPKTQFDIRRKLNIWG